jgi:hypothetical protein
LYNCKTRVIVAHIYKKNASRGASASRTRSKRARPTDRGGGDNARANVALLAARAAAVAYKALRTPSPASSRKLGFNQSPTSPGASALGELQKAASATSSAAASAFGHWQNAQAASPTIASLTAGTLSGERQDESNAIVDRKQHPRTGGHLLPHRTNEEPQAGPEPSFSPNRPIPHPWVRGGKDLLALLMPHAKRTSWSRTARTARRPPGLPAPSSPSRGGGRQNWAHLWGCILGIRSRWLQGCAAAATTTSRLDRCLCGALGT